MSDAEVDAVCERWDQTSPALQRKIVAKMTEKLLAAEADRDRLLAAAKEAAGHFNDYNFPDLREQLDVAIAGR